MVWQVVGDCAVALRGGMVGETVAEERLRHKWVAKLFGFPCDKYAIPECFIWTLLKTGVRLLVSV